MNMTRFHCKMCNYKFVPKTGKMPDRCPYCSKTGGLVRLQTTNEIIKTASDEE